jgi:hypothetical protein
MLDHTRQALNEALREEAAKIAARGDASAARDLQMLLYGATHRLMERRIGPPPGGESAIASTAAAAGPYFAKGRELADAVPLD